MPPKLVEQVAKARAKQNSSASSKGSRFLGRRKPAEQADRSIEEHFEIASFTFKTQYKVDGMSLRDTVIADKRSAQQSGKRLSSAYWKELREKFKPDDTQGNLRVANPAEHVSQELIEGLEAALTPNTTHRSKSKLLAWCHTTATCNQKELCGLGRHLFTLKLATNTVALSVVVESMKMITRSGLQTKFSSTVAHLVEVFDTALCTTLAQMRRSQLSESSWWEIYKPLAALVLDVQAVERMYNATESWIQVAGDVSSVCSLSQVGRKLFGWAQVYVVSARLTDHIDKLLCMLKHDDVTKLSIDEVIQESMQ